MLCPPTPPGANPIPATAPLFIIIGESNSGGTGSFVHTKPGDLDPFDRAYILNNNTLIMEPLDLGTNNLIGHFGLADNSAHAFELEIARRAEYGYLRNIAYIMKSGQGGSVIAEWDTTGSYYQTFLTRYQAASDAMDSIGQAFYPVFMVTIGVNNALASLDSATYRADFQAWIENMRDDIGAPTAPVVIPEITGGGADPDFAVVNSIYNDLEGVLTNFTVIDVSQAYTGGSYHWPYQGLKVIATGMLRSLGLIKQ